MQLFTLTSTREVAIPFDDQLILFMAVLFGSSCALVLDRAGAGAEVDSERVPCTLDEQ